MDFATFTLNNLEENLKCCLCKNYLSYFPIFVTPNNKSICGRCTAPDGLTTFKNESFETVSQFLRFPCRYECEGCPEELLPKEVPEHEEQCPFRIVECILNKCDWRSSLPNLEEHCKSVHSELLLQNGDFQIDLSKNDDCDNLIEFEAGLYIFRREFFCDSQTIKFGLFHNPYDSDMETGYNCQLNVNCQNKSVLCQFKSTKFGESLNDLSLTSLKNDGEIATAKLTIGKLQNSDFSQDQENKNLALLNILKCVNCSRIAMPPIFRCVENTDCICAICKQSHRKSCKVCSQTVYAPSNQILEKISAIVDYPCKNQKNGCSYISKYLSLQIHHMRCKYKDQKCPLHQFETCLWEGLNKDMANHIYQNHENYILKSSHFLEFSTTTKTCNILKFYDTIFRLTYWFENSRYFWLVEKIGHGQNQFKYEISITDSTNRGQKLLIRKECLNRLIDSEKDDNFLKRLGMAYCYFDKDQVSYFGREAVKFSVKIFKF